MAIITSGSLGLPSNIGPIGGSPYYGGTNFYHPLGTGTPNPAMQVAPIANPFDAQIANAKAALYSPQQLRTIANQQVGAQVRTALGQSNASSKAEQAQFAALQNRATGLAAGLAGVGEPTAEQTYNAYMGAANTMAALGGGITGQAGTDWQAEQAAAQDTISRDLGPGVGKFTSYSPQALQSAAQYGGVTLPGAGLANEALTQRGLTAYGVQADKANIGAIAQDYAAQAVQALNQRAAERASIIAQRPELFQQALQAQRDDNARTQQRVDSLVSASANWLQNQRRLTDAEKAQKASIAQNLWARTHMTPAQKAAAALATKQADRNWITQQIAATHIDPVTHQPVGGFAWTDPSHTTVAPITSIWAHTAQTAQTGIAKSTSALNWTTRNGYISDAQGHPIPDPVTGATYQPITGYKLKPDGSGVVATLSPAAIATANQNKTTMAQNWTKINLYKSRADGSPIYGPGHKLQPIGGYKLDASGNVVPIQKKTAGQSLDPVTKLKIQGTIADYASGLKNGAYDSKTGQQTQAPVTDPREAYKMMQARGYFDDPRFTPFAIKSLEQAYGLTDQQVIDIASGIPVKGAPGTTTTTKTTTKRPPKPGPDYQWQGGEWVKGSIVRSVPSRFSGGIPPR